jgi:hypothetical protein
VTGKETGQFQASEEKDGEEEDSRVLGTKGRM